jgi:hypothetical protein
VFCPLGTHVDTTTSGYRDIHIESKMQQPTNGHSNSDIVSAQPKIAYVIAVIAKCPIAGHSKTRLQPLFAHNTTSTTTPDDGAAILSKAMLCDVLVSISHCCRQARRHNSLSSNDSNIANILIDQLLFYAPPTNEGCQMMQHIVDTCHNSDGSLIKDDWTLLPIDNTKPNTTTGVPMMKYESQSNNLSNILSNVVRTGQTRHSSNIPTTVILFGMDAPEIPMNEIYRILTTTSTTRRPPLPITSTSVSQVSSSTTTTAFLCPAYDGGYAMLSIPPLNSLQIMDSIFQSVSPYWSHPLTAITQIKALSDVGISTVIGPMVHDIDTPDDVLALIQRLKSKSKISTDTTKTTVTDDTNDEMVRCCLYRPSVLLTSTHPLPRRIFDDHVPCQHIQQALVDLHLF